MQPTNGPLSTGPGALFRFLKPAHYSVPVDIYGALAARALSRVGSYEYALTTKANSKSRLRPRKRNRAAPPPGCVHAERGRDWLGWFAAFRARRPMLILAEMLVAERKRAPYLAARSAEMQRPHRPH